MKNLIHKQILAKNKESVPLKDDDFENVYQEKQTKIFQERSENIKVVTQNLRRLDSRGKFNFKKTAIVDESIQELSCAVKLLSNKISENEKSSQELACSISLLSNKINKLDKKQKRNEQRFQSVYVQPIKLIQIENYYQKDRKEERLDNKQEKKERIRKRKERVRMMNNWLGTVCNDVFSTGFSLYKKDELKLKEVKAFCSENMLRNIINLSKQNKLTADDFENIDNCLTKDLLPYYKSKYPQTLESEVNIALSKKIIPIDNMESNEYDFIFKSKIKFDITGDGNYNQNIMDLTNYVVGVPQKQIWQIEGRQKLGDEDEQSLFDCFYHKMNDFMQFICKKPEDRVDKSKISQIKNQNCGQNQSKDLAHKKQEQKESTSKEDQLKQKQYEQKVRSYSSFQIGQKLSKNFELYSQAERAEQSMRFKSSAQIRVLTKWCEQLEKYFDEDYIMERQVPFRMKDGSQGSLKSVHLRLLCALLAYERLQIKKRLKQIKENNYLIQYKFSSMSVHESLEVFLEQEAMIGQFSIGVYKCYENYLTNYLNVLIHRINMASRNFLNILIYENQNIDKQQEYLTKFLGECGQNTYLSKQINKVTQYILGMDQNKRETNQKFYSGGTPQLISFNIGDLIRCRYTSKQYEILTIYDKLFKDSDIKIIRVKNRLNEGNRDILINALYKNQIVTQIQLCIKSEKSRFIECSNQFNHFFYELKRAQFGPISQMVNLWVSYDSRSKHFMERIDDFFGVKIKKQNDYDLKLTSDVCCSQLKQKIISLPFECDQCKSYHFDVYQSHGNTICQNCDKYCCLNCKLTISEINRTLSIDKQKIKKITVVKQKKILLDKNGNVDKRNLVLLNLKSKERKARPFKVIEQDKKIHLFEKKQKTGEFVLIKTFRKNEELKKQIKKFLHKNLVIQIDEIKQLTQTFKLQDTISNYFIPKFFQVTYQKQKDSILIRAKNLKDENIPKDLQKKRQRQKIKVIDFSQNDLKKIETVIQAFPNIESLNLSMNNLQILPKSIFEQGKLRILNLGNNNIKSLPQVMCYSKIEQLYLQCNQIQKITNELLKFDQLKILKLGSNKINMLPKNIPKMDNLELLELQENLITQIPEQFFNFKNLKILRLFQNRISKLPQKKPEMNCLQALSLQNNKITEVPDEFFNFEKLKILRLWGNGLKKLPRNKPNMKCLQELHLNNNQIQDIPDEFFNFCQLKKMSLKKNKISKLPQNKPNMGNLESFDLSQNQITTVSSVLFDFSFLTKLSIDNNPITQIEKVPICPKLREFKFTENATIDQDSLNNLQKIIQMISNNKT